MTYGGEGHDWWYASLVSTVIPSSVIIHETVQKSQEQCWQSAIYDKKYMMKIFLFCVVDFMNVLELLKSLDGHLNNWFDEDEHVKVGKMWVKESLVNFKRF